MSTTAGCTRRPNRWPCIPILLAGVFLPVARLAPQAEPREKPPSAAADGERKVTAGLILDQALVGTLLNESLTVRTKYGVLTVPVEDLIRVRLRPTLSREDSKRLDDVLSRWSSSVEDSSMDEAAKKEILELGVPAYHGLVEAHETAEAPFRDKLDELLDEIRSIEDVYLGDTDEIVAKRFTIRGVIVEEAFSFDSLSATINIPRSDILHLTYRELEIRKVWKIGPQHMERQGFLDTQHKLRKKHKITLIPSGAMVYEGRSYGPGGLSNHRWNSRNLGCLQWRVGSGPWKILGSTFEGSVESAGSLQFSVHLYNSNASGQFKVEFKAKKKK